MNKYRLGVEISADSLRLAVIAKHSAYWHVLETAELTLAGGDIQQNLRTLLKNIAPGIKQIILGLPHQRVLIKEVFIDSSLSYTEVYQYLQQQALPLFGKLAEHWVIDCEAQAHSFRAAAAEREYVLNWVRLFRRLKKQVLAVDVDILALARLTPSLQGYQPERTQILLWLKPDELVFVAVKAGKLIYTKSAGYCANINLTETVPTLLQFFSRLYPEHQEAEIEIIHHDPAVSAAVQPFKSAKVNPDIWHSESQIPMQAYCSLGIAIYDY